MRRVWRWVIYGKPKPPLPPIVLTGDWVVEDPRTDALVAIAASVERFAVAAESVVGALERAEARALEAEAALKRAEAPALEPEPAKELDG